MSNTDASNPQANLTPAFEGLVRDFDRLLRDEHVERNTTEDIDMEPEYEIQIDEENETPASFKEKLNNLCREEVAKAKSKKEAEEITKQLSARYRAWVEGPYAEAFREEVKAIIVNLGRSAKQHVLAAGGMVSAELVAEFERHLAAELEQINPRYRVVMTDTQKDTILTTCKEALTEKDFFGGASTSETVKGPSFGAVDEMGDEFDRLVMALVRW